MDLWALKATKTGSTSCWSKGEELPTPLKTKSRVSDGTRDGTISTVTQTTLTSALDCCSGLLTHFPGSLPPHPTLKHSLFSTGKPGSFWSTNYNLTAPFNFPMTSYHRTKYQFHRGASELSAISSCSGSHDPAPSAPALETQDTWGSGCPCALLCTETSVPRTPAHHTASPLHSNLPYCPSKPLSLAMVTFTLPLYFGTSLVAQLVKASVCNAGDPGSIPGSGRSPGEGHGNPLQSLAWKIPWTEEPDRLQSMGLQRVGHDWATSHSLFWRRKQQPTPVLLLGEFCGQRSGTGCSLWKSKQLDMTVQLTFSSFISTNASLSAYVCLGFPGGTVVINPPADTRDTGDVG